MERGVEERDSDGEIEIGVDWVGRRRTEGESEGGSKGKLFVGDQLELALRRNFSETSTHRVCNLAQLGSSDRGRRSSLEQLGESLERLEEGGRRRKRRSAWIEAESVEGEGR